MYNMLIMDDNITKNDIVCGVCGAIPASSLYPVIDKFTGESFTVAECGCGHACLTDPPLAADMHKYYPSEYSWREDLSTPSAIVRFIRRLEKWYRYNYIKGENRRIYRLRKNGGAVLDIGCGTGDKLDLLRSKGYEVKGVEISPEAEYAKNVFKLDVQRTDILEAEYPDKSFDIVTLYHVLEHLPDLSASLLKIRRILKPGGILILQVPNFASFQRRLFGRKWSLYDPPRHLQDFTPLSLRKVLEANDMAVTHIDTRMGFWHPPGYVLSLFPSLDPQFAWATETKKTSSLFKRAMWVVLTIAFSPVAWIENIIGRGGIMTAYAQLKDSI